VDTPTTAAIQALADRIDTIESKIEQLPQDDTNLHTEIKVIIEHLQKLLACSNGRTMATHPRIIKIARVHGMKL